MEDDKWKLKLTSVLWGFYIHIGGLKQALKFNNETLRPVFIASIAYWLFISGIMLDALQK